MSDTYINQKDDYDVPIWHTQHEKVLRAWGESAACYRYMHSKAHIALKCLSLRMTLPIIILSTLTGTANFAQDTLPPNVKIYAPSVIGAMNLFAAILTTILQFLKVNELMESHRVSSIHYGKLARHIRLQLSLPKIDRSSDGTSMVNSSKSEYDRLIEQSPSIPMHIVRAFESVYPDTPNGDKKIVFSRPEILSIRAIELYEGGIEDDHRYKERMMTEMRDIKDLDRVAELSTIISSNTERQMRRDEDINSELSAVIVEVESDKD